MGQEGGVLGFSQVASDVILGKTLYHKGILICEIRGTEVI